MTTSTLESTQYILLKKTPFQESGWVVSGISPQFGRIDFLSKGTRSIGKKKFPIIGLFREYTVSFRFSKNQDGQLAFLSSLELNAIHDSIANNLQSYLHTCELASFLLRIIPPMCEIPMIWKAFSSMLVRMERQDTPPSICTTMFLLVFAQEQGILPSNLLDNPGTINSLLTCALTPIQTIPNISSLETDRLCNWANRLIALH